MTDALNATELTLLFVLTVFALAAAFVWMFCEAEQQAVRRRSRDPRR